MADSNITKRALSAALKALMKEKPFQKISIADICEKCSMNRQSFYYHFKDKYELMIWIFDTDFLALIQKQKTSENALEIVSQICKTMYENRLFYRNAFSVQGQNSLCDHLRELVAPLLLIRLREAMPNREVSSFHIQFISDAILAALLRWISDDPCMPPEQFIERISSCIFSLADHISSIYPSE